MFLEQSINSSKYKECMVARTQKLFVMKELIDLTPEEYTAITRNYPQGHQLYYIWTGILALRGYKLPMTLAEMNIKQVSKYSYLVNVYK
jgi:hypothetical protein